MRTKYENGLVLGKFMPLHLGHEYVIKTALQNSKNLTVIVYSLPGQPIDGPTRQRWVRSRFPGARVIHVRDFSPVYPEWDDRYWKMWASQIKERHPEPIDALFTSETYGDRLAEELGATHVCVDRERRTFSISATEIRENPDRYIGLVSPVARPYFEKLAARCRA